MVVRKRLSLTGPAIAFITTTVFEWKPVLVQDNVAKILVQEFENLANLYNVSILSYVIMPSHIHALFGFHKIEVLSKIVQMFKSIISRRVKNIRISELKENDYRLWKPRFDDLVITTEKQLKIKIDYIHNNPVKAGLVANAMDWKYSSAVDWLTEKEGLIKVDKNYHWLVDR